MMSIGRLFPEDPTFQTLHLIFMTKCVMIPWENELATIKLLQYLLVPKSLQNGADLA
jgi:hypothetical protein